jgi:hypothetical protein
MNSVLSLFLLYFRVFTSPLRELEMFIAGKTDKSRRFKPFVIDPFYQSLKEEDDIGRRILYTRGVPIQRPTKIIL